jgi:hypothetical protein
MKQSLLVNNMRKTISTMLAMALIFFTFSSSAQNGALKGSGKTINKSFLLTNFNKIELLDLDGKIEVEVGKPFSISADIDDNLEKLLEASVSEGTLEVKLKGNFNNRLYVEDTKINIKICLPEIVSVFHRSNGNLTVNGISGKYFRIKNTGNGSAYLHGSIDKLDIVCRNNGSVDAKNLKAQTVAVKRSGNGNVYVNPDKVVSIHNSGNGNVVTDKKDSAQYAREKITATTKGKPAYSITNLSAKNATLSVKCLAGGAYGMDVKPLETMDESFPVGATNYRGNQIAIL